MSPNNTSDHIITKEAGKERLEIDLHKLPRPLLGRNKEWCTLADFAWRCAASHVNYSRGRWHMDAAWDASRNYQWVWDTAFMTLYCRFSNGQLPGIASFDNFYEMQADDGYIGMTYDMHTSFEPWPDRINPPLFAWAEWEYYRTTGDESRIDRVIPHIERLMAWIEANRRTAPHRRRHTEGKGEDGAKRDELYQLYHFEDCGSSGMDNSPRTPRVAAAGQFYDWIDLSSQMALSYRMLGRLHAACGRTAEADAREQQARELGELINAELWCDATSFYHDRMLPHNFVTPKTAAGFWPLLAGIVPPRRVAALVAQLRNPKTFNRAIPVPTLAADDINYDSAGGYWLGGTWAPTNYMITRGLQLAGEGDEAHHIAVKYLKGLARTYREFAPHTLWECYAPDCYKPATAARGGGYVKPDFVGWSGIGPLAMLIENIIGLDLDRPANRLVWDIRLTEAHGIENFAVAPGTLRAYAARRSSAADTAEVELAADVDLNIEIRCAGRKRRARLRAGKPLNLTV